MCFPFWKHLQFLTHKPFPNMENSKQRKKTLRIGIGKSRYRASRHTTLSPSNKLTRSLTQHVDIVGARLPEGKVGAAGPPSPAGIDTENQMLSLVLLQFGG